MVLSDSVPSSGRHRLQWCLQSTRPMPMRWRSASWETPDMVWNSERVSVATSSCLMEEMWDDPCPHDLFRINREKIWSRYSAGSANFQYTQQKNGCEGVRECVCYRYGRGLERGAQLHHREAHTLRFTFSQPRLAEETQKTMQVCDLKWSPYTDTIMLSLWSGPPQKY